MPRSRTRLRKDEKEEKEVPATPVSTELQRGLESDIGRMGGRLPVDGLSEVWLNVFEKLDDQDKATFSQACPEYGFVVKKKQTEFLLPEIAPTLMEILPQSSLLQGRQLCQAWTKELDSQNQAHPSNLYVEGEIAEMEEPHVPKHLNRFSSCDEVRKFMWEMKEHQGNPFPGRSIHFEWHSRGLRGGIHSCRKYWTEVIKLLEKFGSHIHFATFGLNSSMKLLGLDAIESLRNCLFHVSHLRRLNVMGLQGRNDTINENRAYLETNPFPKLYNLEALELHSLNYVLMSAIVGSCSTPAGIKRLVLQRRLKWDSKNNENELFGHVCNFVNLEVLKANLELSDVEKLSDARVAKFREMLLAFSELSRDAEDIMYYLEPIGGSLLYLRVEKLKCLYSSDDPTPTNSRFPKLRRLSLWDYSGSLNLFIQLPSLTHLELRNLRHGNAEAEVNKIYIPEKNPYISNIWKWMPSLKKLTVRNKMYERHLYEQQRAEKTLTESYISTPPAADSDVLKETTEVTTFRQTDLEVDADKVTKDSCPAAMSEIWHNVFEKLDKREDKVSFSHASSEWHDLVERKRTLLLFPEVQETMPSKVLFVSRGLCKFWNEELDQKSQSHPSQLALDFETVPIDDDVFKHTGHFPLQTKHFSSAENIRQFMQDMERHPGNPFPGRNVTLHWKRPNHLTHDDEEEEPELVIPHCREYWTEVENLLKKYGMHIHFVTLRPTVKLLGVDFVEKLRDCLFHLSSLKKLKLSREPYERKDIAPVVNRQIPTFCRRNPLPQLLNLETLELHYVPTALVQAVLDSCTTPINIKRLCCLESGENGFELSTRAWKFPNLEVLHSDNFRFEDLERMRNLDRIPPLRKLELEKFKEDITTQQLFSALESFANTLTHFKTFHHIRVADPPNIKINLPRLKKLEFYTYEGSLDPLLQLTSLTQLKIKGLDWESTKTWPGNKIFVYPFQAYNSNIWKLMPTLNTLVFDGVMCERHIYEQICREDFDEMDIDYYSTYSFGSSASDSSSDDE